MQTYPSTVAQMSWAELHFFKMLFNFGSDSFCTSSGCIGIGEVVHRDSCKWALVPLERAGDDEEDSGPPPPEDSSALPNPDEEDNTTCRCWEHRSELCRLSPSSDIFALRIWSRMNPQSRWHWRSSSTWLVMRLRFQPWTSYTRADCFPFNPACSIIKSRWSENWARAFRTCSSSRKMAGLLSRKKWHSSIDFSKATSVRYRGVGKLPNPLPLLTPPPLFVSTFKTGNWHTKRGEKKTKKKC